MYICDVMGTKRMSLGKWGEDRALEYLENEGLFLRDRNWRSSHKELDLVMETPAKLHIIEVKTLKAPSPIEPWEHVNQTKQSALVAAANHYISENHIHKEVQFDIVSILVALDGKNCEIKYIPNAFFPIYYTH